MKVSDIEKFSRDFRRERMMQGAMRGKPYRRGEEVKADKAVTADELASICHMFGDVQPKSELGGRCLSFEVFGVRYFAAAES